MRIEFLNKDFTESILPKLFHILHLNMSKITPSENSYDKDFEMWISSVKPALENDPRQILLIYDDNEIIGFFQYYVNNGIFMMEEIQFLDKYKGTGVFAELYRHLTEIIPHDTEFVEAYANKRNHKSIGILHHLGLNIIFENNELYHFRGKYERILQIYGTKINERDQ